MTILSPHTISSIYFTYFHYHLRYGLIFCGGDTKIKASLDRKSSLCKQSVTQEVKFVVGSYLGY
jgi:hypothetical protein